MAGNFNITFSDYTSGVVPIFSIHGANSYFEADLGGKQGVLYFTIFEAGHNDPANIKVEVNGIIEHDVSPYAFLYDEYEYNDPIFKHSYTITKAMLTQPVGAFANIDWFQIYADTLSNLGIVVDKEIPAIGGAGAVPVSIPYVLGFNNILYTDRNGYLISDIPTEGGATPPSNWSIQEVAYGNYDSFQGLNTTGVTDSDDLFAAVDQSMTTKNNIALHGLMQYNKTTDIITNCNDGVNSFVNAVLYNATNNKLLLIGSFTHSNAVPQIDANKHVIIYNVGTGVFEEVTTTLVSISGDGVWKSKVAWNTNSDFMCNYDNGTYTKGILHWDGNNTITESVIPTPATVASGNFVDAFEYDVLNDTYYALINQSLIKKWNGTAWVNVFDVSASGYDLYNITIDNGILYAVGDDGTTQGVNYLDGGATVTGLGGLIKINLTTGVAESFGTLVFYDSYYVNLAKVYNGKVYIGGGFANITHNGITTTVNCVARYNIATNTWEDFVGTGTLSDYDDISMFAFSGNDVYIGGYFGGLDGTNLPHTDVFGDDDSNIVLIKNANV